MAKSGKKKREVETHGLQGRWEEFISSITTGSTPQDINALVQHALRESYLQATEDLRFYAEKVHFFNELKERIRGLIHAARLAKEPPGGDELTEPFRMVCIEAFPGFNEDGRAVVIVRDCGMATTTAELMDYITDLEAKLATVGDNAQLANVDLQNMLQKQQQTMQMMSNVSKMLHDTAMAIIRKIGD